VLRVIVAESEGFSPEAREILAEIAEVRLLDLERPQLLASAAEADVLWVRLRHRIDREVLGAAPQLKAIASPTTGLNHIDLAEAERRGIRILSLKGETAFLRTVFATAEHTIGLLLALIRSIPAAAAHTRAGGWNRDLFRGHELQGMTAGVVGYGRIGRMVANYLRAFGVRVLASDPRPDLDPDENNVTLVSLETLLAESDIVTLHADLSPASRGFFGVREFALMKPGSWFLNTARGELVDESSLLSALETGKLAGAALDVLCDERSTGMSGYPLVEYARRNTNLILTPHLGGCTAESMGKTEVFLAGRVAEYLMAYACVGSAR
jgi:D-3-phosphoglycerate dehydrogenase / 2-oxoglutarate reductase